MYGWGDITEEEFRDQREASIAELNELPVENQGERTLERFADLISSVKNGWNEADHAQRNRLARVLFEGVKAQDKKVVAIKPVKEMESFSGYRTSVNKKVLLATPTGFDLATPCPHAGAPPKFRRVGLRAAATPAWISPRVGCKLYIRCSRFGHRRNNDQGNQSHDTSCIVIHEDFFRQLRSYGHCVDI